MNISQGKSEFQSVTITIETPEELVRLREVCDRAKAASAPNSPMHDMALYLRNALGQMNG